MAFKMKGPGKKKPTVKELNNNPNVKQHVYFLGKKLPNFFSFNNKK